MIAAGDLWVDPLSASIGLRNEQIFVVRGNHTQIVKPKTKTADSYRYLRPRIEKYAYSVSALNREIEKWTLHERTAAGMQDIAAVHDFAVGFWDRIYLRPTL